MQYDLNISGIVRHHRDGPAYGGGLAANAVSMKLDPNSEAANYGQANTLPESAATFLANLHRYSQNNAVRPVTQATAVVPLPATAVAKTQRGFGFWRR
jgi:hypothetical protein